MSSLLVWWILVAGSMAFAAPDCPRTLGAGPVLLDMQKLNAIFSAVMGDIIQHIEGLPQAQFEAARALARANLSETPVYDRTFPFIFDGAYPRRFEISSAGPFERLKAPYTPYSRPIMKKLALALRLLNIEITREETTLEAQPEFARNHAVLKAKTYAGPYLAEAIYFAHQSLLSAVAQLVQGSINGLSAQQLFRLVALEQDGRASLVVQFALALPPRLLGQYGEQFFVRPALKRSSDGRLIFSTRLRRHLKTQRDHAATFDWSSYEFGKGCPVAHCFDGAESSSLQLYLDAIVRLMERR